MMERLNRALHMLRLTADYRSLDRIPAGCLRLSGRVLLRSDSEYSVAVLLLKNILMLRGVGQEVQLATRSTIMPMTLGPWAILQKVISMFSHSCMKPHRFLLSCHVCILVLFTLQVSTGPITLS